MKPLLSPPALCRQLVLLLLPWTTHADPFAPGPGPLPALNMGQVAWGDFDRDGRLDLVLAGSKPAGSSLCEVWRSLGGGVYTNINANLPGFQAGGLAWADMDRDGDLDLALAANAFTQIRRNDGNGVFTDIQAGLPALGGSGQVDLAWGDYDQDGDPDLVVAGNYWMDIHQNKGGGIFAKLRVILPRYRSASVAWGDFDRDGDLDLAVSGRNYFSYNATEILRNDGPAVCPPDDGAMASRQTPPLSGSPGCVPDFDVVFTPVAPRLPGWEDGALAWVDYDGDGDLDLSHTGMTNNSALGTRLWRNDGAGAFSDQSSGLPLAAAGFASLAWGDYDNDGQQDLLLGSGGFVHIGGRVWRNAGGGSFSEITSGLPILTDGVAAWGDADGDGDLDVALTTGAGGIRITQVATNLTTTANTPPSAPGSPALTQLPGGILEFSWAAATDAQTPSAGLSYALRLGTSPGAADILRPPALASGLRLLPAPGPLTGTSARPLRALPAGLYYGAVQAVDTGLAGGPFSPEQEFMVVYPPVPTTQAARVSSPGSLTLTGTVVPNAPDTTWYFEWGETDSYGQVTPVETLPFTNAAMAVSALVPGLTPGASVQYRLVAVNPVGTSFGANLTATPFAFVTQATLPTTHYGSDAAWGDYDSDGDLDLMLVSEESAARKRLQRNDGNGVFTGVATGLANGLQGGAVAWGDMDGDGDLDLAQSGHSGGSARTQIFRNNGGGAFADTGIVLPGLWVGSLAWGDIDGDGDLDLAIAGISAQGGLLCQIRRNEGGTQFPDIGAGLPGHWNGELHWVDVDGDGDLDLSLSGGDGLQSYLHIRRNDGLGGFPELATGIAPLANACHAWADADNDGDPDLLHAGMDGTGTRRTRLYRNDPGPVFTLVPTPLPGVSDGSLAWGDFDQDGSPDVALMGMVSATNAVTQVWRNEGSGAFSPVTTDLPGLHSGRLAWGDVDQDRDLDLVVAGETADYQDFTLVARNTLTVPNTRPSAPVGLSAVALGLDGITLSWTAAADDHTPASGLQYNLRVWNTATGIDALPGEAAVNGFRRVPAPGNARQGLSHALRNLPAGTYQWIVQAVDSALQGGIFSLGPQFTIADSLRVRTDATTALASTSATLNGEVRPGSLSATAWFEWGETTSYGNTTPTAVIASGTQPQSLQAPISGLPTGVTHHYRLVASNALAVVHGADRVFTTPVFENANAALPGLSSSAGAWGDWDGDGDLDLAMHGIGVGGYFSRMLRNEGAGVFANQSTPIPGIAYGALAWADADLDGDLDLAMAGGTDSGWHTRLYTNTAGAFTLGQNLPPPLVSAALAWADYDGDGRPDLALSGLSTSSWQPVTDVLRNPRNGPLVSSGISLPALQEGSLAWADADGDGDPDLALSGTSIGDGVVGAGHASVRRNNGAVDFTDLGAGLPDLDYGDLAWGDCDGDGDPDLAIAGWAGGQAILRVLRNDGGVFTNRVAELPGVIEPSLAWGDVDGDGDADLVVAGKSGGIAALRIHANDGGVFTRTLPADAPGILSAFVALGDADGDGDLDLLASGVGASGLPESRLLRNTVNPVDLPPGAPTGLTAVTNLTGEVTMSWLPAVDDHTPTAALTYNLRVGSGPGLGDFLPAHASTNGWRHLPAPGNAGASLQYRLRDLPHGHYTWSVQAVDAAFHGGVFSTNGTFSVVRDLPPLEAWRFRYFGITQNAGLAADGVDADGDGQINLVEYALNGDPLHGPARRAAAVWTDNTFCITFTRARGAVGEVATTVEWSASLLPGQPWSTESLTETQLDSNGEEVTVRVCLPAGFAPPLYLRLNVTTPSIAP